MPENLKSTFHDAISSQPLVTDFSFLPVTPEAMEQDPLALAQGFASLGDRHLLTLKVPQEWGGGGLTVTEYFQFQIALTRHSGTLAFTQTQHQSAASFIAKSENTALKSGYLTSMATGQKRVGIGFSHLRRLDKCSLSAIPNDRGYRLTGMIPWLTGWGIFEEAVIAATLPDGGSVWGLIPLQETPHLRPSTPMGLAAMPATQTVTIALENYLLDHEHILDTHPSDWFSLQDQQGILSGTAFSLGTAQAALDWIQQASQQHRELQPAYAALQQQWNDCQQGIMKGLSQLSQLSTESTELSLEERFTLRGTALALAGRCVHAAVTVSGGSANLLNHPAQRMYREMMVFTVSGQQLPILRATLDSIAGL